ncbi:uncharacterized protein LOC143036412 isoform X2 [Oratosquilla oratoria]
MVGAEIAGIPPALEDAVESLKETINAGRTDIFRKLLEACDKCDGGGEAETRQMLNALSTQYGTFLHMATKLERADIVRALLAAGADPGVQDQDGNTPVHLVKSSKMEAIYTEELLRTTAQSDVGKVCQLLAAGLSVNAQDNPLSRNTPLHWAASFADTDTITCLVARGADVNVANSNGATPLHDAVARGDPAVVKELLLLGANPHIQCHKGRHKGKTPVEMASSKPQLHEILKNSAVNGTVSYNGANNGSISPLLDRKISTQNSGGSLAHGISGSIESLTSIGRDSVMSANSPPVRNTSPDNISVPSRSQLNSTSSLEISPKIEQLSERLAAAHLVSPVRPLVTNSALHMLWPPPRRITELQGKPWKPQRDLGVSMVQGQVSIHRILDVWNVHKPFFSDFGYHVHLENIISPQEPQGNSVITCSINPAQLTMPGEYRIRIFNDTVAVTATDIPSLHSALVTLLQLLHLCGGSGGESEGVPCVVISDYPTIVHRGVMLDFGQHARIPTLVTMYHIVDTLLGLKINQLHLFLHIGTTSHTLPFSPSEVVSLERYCQDRGLSIVPVVELDSSVTREKLPKALQSMTHLLQHFSDTEYVHIGPRLSALLVDVSRDGVNHWTSLSLPQTCNLMVCANVFHTNRAAVKLLPLSAVLVEYGFQADYDFTKGSQLSIEEGRTLGLCPGTAAWSSISGWPEAGVSNVYSGVVSAVEGGARCVIVAHWSGGGSVTPLVFAWPPILIAAGLTWNHNTHWDFVHSSLSTLLDIHLIQTGESGIGAALVELGRCETWLTRLCKGQATTDVTDLPSTPGSTSYQLLADPDMVNLENMTAEVFSSVIRHIKRVLHEGQATGSTSITSAASSSPWPLASIAVMELHLAADMIFTSCRLGRALVSMGTNPRSNMGLAVVNPGVANLPPTVRTDLANKVLALREVYSSVWMRSLQAPGLQASLLVLTSLLARLLPDQQQQQL